MLRPTWSDDHISEKMTIPKYCQHYPNLDICLITNIEHPLLIDNEKYINIILYIYIYIYIYIYKERESEREREIYRYCISISFHHFFF